MIHQNSTSIIIKNNTNITYLTSALRPGTVTISYNSFLQMTLRLAAIVFE